MFALILLHWLQIQLTSCHTLISGLDWIEIVIIRSGRHCSGTESVTLLIYSSWNRTRHRMFAFVSLIFSNLKLKLINKIHTH